ncbi:MAG: alpha-amylase family glycosyl hydrolase [Candidatus Pacearchaeota archaeon]
MIKKNSVLYQIITDRFDNEKGNLYEHINSPEYNLKFKDYLGGTFNGIKRRLDYLQNLGVDNILISPVQSSPFYHGYHIEDHFNVNLRFGTEEDLKNLIKECHDRDIGVMMDYAPTHVSSTNPIFSEKILSEDEKDKDWFIFLSRLREDSPYRDYFEELVYKLTSGDPAKLKDINKAKYLGYFGESNLPLLNLANPDVIEYHRRVIYHWIKEFEFNSIRLDSGFIQPKDFIKKIRNYIHTSFKNIDVIVEYWDFEFPPRSGDCYGFCDGEFDIKSTLWFNRMSEDTQNFFRNLSGHYYRTKDHVEDYIYITGLGNHDLPRFKGGKNLQKIAAVLQFTLPFTPMIYYGEEIGMEQYNDCSERVAQSRDPMRWDLYDPDLYNFYKNLVHFRRSNSFEKFSMGDVQINDNGMLFTYKIKLEKESYYIILNMENREKPVNLTDLFPNSCINNFDIPSGMPVVFDSPNILTLKPESAYLFAEKKI